MRSSVRLCSIAMAAALAVLAGAATPAQAHAQAPGPVAPLGPDFLWGVAASGFQTEGSAPDSNWTRYIARSGYEPYLNSVDSYHRFLEDIARAAALGVKVYRVSIEWARVQPRPDGWDEGAFLFYDALIGAITAAGMRPMLTLDHWVYPGWVSGDGGWQGDRMVQRWLTGMRRVVDRYANRNPLWVTINEPVAYIVQELNNTGVPGADRDRVFNTIADRMAQAHNGIYDYIHGVQPGAMVTSNVGFVAKADEQVNGPWVDRIRDRLDYVGVDYYFDAVADPKAVARSAAGSDTLQLWELPLASEGIYYALRRYQRIFPGKSLYVVENGMATENGLPRPDGYDRADYLRDVVYWLQRARMDGIPVIGYNYWSITDNYEWGSYTPRFGLYTVDVRSDPILLRRPTDAVGAYSEITRSGGVPGNYLPTRPPAGCSQIDPPSSCDDPVTLPGV